MEGLVAHRRALLAALGACVLGQALTLTVGIATSATPLICLSVLLTLAALALLILTIAGYAAVRSRSS